MSYNVKTLGAIGDGRRDETAVLQKAIDQAAWKGGGTVIIPAGTYRCGTLRLRSNLHLILEAGALLQGDLSQPALYPVIAPTPYGNLPGQIQALLWGDDLENVTISGPGTIDGGGGSPLWGEEAAADRFRPALAFFHRCRNLHLTETTFQNSCFWTIHLLRCEDVRIRGCRILAHPHRINTDGIDPDGCRNVIISDCFIRTGDDAIVVKSTEGDPCENITVTNCVVSSQCCALKIGTEAIGPIRNITMGNCVVDDSNMALALYMKDGSTYENITFHNLIMRARGNFIIHVDNDPRDYTQPNGGIVRNILFSNLQITSPGRIYLEGRPDHPLKGIRLQDINWTLDGDTDFSKASKPAGARRVNPDPNAPNHATRRAHLIARHVHHLGIRQFTLLDERPEPWKDRRFAWLEDCPGALLDNVPDLHLD